MQEQRFIVLTDLPVTSGDCLNRRASAVQISNLIKRSRDNSPFTVGIDGTWGAGKSSVMMMIEEELRKNNTLTVWYNAWMHQHKKNRLKVWSRRFSLLSSPASYPAAISSFTGCSAAVSALPS